MEVLAGNWSIAMDPHNGGKRERWFTEPPDDVTPAPVPGIIQQVFPGYHGVAWYWHKFRLRRKPESGERVLLRFGAVDYLAEVWVNGVAIGAYEGGETPFELDATAATNPDADNLLAVRVLNPTIEQIDGYTLETIPHRNKVVPPRCGSALNSGGIMHPVELYIVPEVRTADIFAKAEPASGKIEVELTLLNNGSAASPTVLVNVAPASAGSMLDSISRRIECPPGESVCKCTLTVPQPRLWELDDPFLYRITALLGEHESSVRFGFRDFRVVDGFFELNGRRIFLKSTHTGNSTPIGQQLPVVSDHVRRDIIYAKASGFNCVRFIAGVAWPEQLDCCDEVGIMVYEESYAGWCLGESPLMGSRFDGSTAAMIRRDRNHPSITIWGLLNETWDGPVFRQAVAFLPKLRTLDPTRLVLLNSGRWDCQPSIGSVSNPGGMQWEHVWGAEAPEAPSGSTEWCQQAGGYFPTAGDAHAYPGTPQTPEINHFLRTLGAHSKPVFLSEYGIGSLMNIITELRHFQQAGARNDLEDAAIFKAQVDELTADWTRLGFDDVYAFPEEMLRESQRLHARQRTLGFDCIRSNPRLAGYNLTGMLDHGLTGEGLWTYWREWKPSTFDAVSDGWAPLRWCMFVNPSHSYSGSEFTVEAVLANEGELSSGEYPATFRIMGPSGLVWEKKTVVSVNDSFVSPATCETVNVEGPPGIYTFAASMESASPSGGRINFHLSCKDDLHRPSAKVATWGIDDRAIRWLSAHGVECVPFDKNIGGDIMIVGFLEEQQREPDVWDYLRQPVSNGAVAIILDPRSLSHGEDSTHWLPLEKRGRSFRFRDWLYHKECVVRRHPLFKELPSPGILDWDYYGAVIPHTVFDGLDTPDETIAASFANGHPNFPTGYHCGLLAAGYKVGNGMLYINTFNILENLGLHPAADRLMLNFITYVNGRI